MHAQSLGMHATRTVRVAATASPIALFRLSAVRRYSAGQVPRLARAVSPSTVRLMPRPSRFNVSVLRHMSTSGGAAVKVPANLISELRKRTEAGVMDCKVPTCPLCFLDPPYTCLQEALAAHNLDVEKAADWLIKKGRSAKGKVRHFSLLAAQANSACRRTECRLRAS